MDLAQIVSTAFAAASLGALGFFTHKVAWLVRFKRLQRALIDRANAHMRQARERVLPEWEQFAEAAWRVARGPACATGGELDGPAAYVKAVERQLGSRVEATKQISGISPLLVSSLTHPGRMTHTILEVPLGDGTVAAARLRLEPPAVIEPPAPPPEMFQLDARSRYSFWRRALVFVTGLADVVYSSSHIAKMSQYTHVPTGTILRRMSLVVLLVLGIVLEVVMGLRAGLEEWLEHEVLTGAGWSRSLPGGMQDNLASLVALGVWTAAVAGLYFGLYFFVRSRSKRHLVELRRLEKEQQGRLATIRSRHLGVLEAWAERHGLTLDGAVELTCRHVELLAKHHAARVRRRMCGPALIEAAKAIERMLFAQLPEATATLQDRVTMTERSWPHALWPRAEEMRDVVEQAQLREAWQTIELTLGELRLGQPDPDRVADFWRQLVIYSASFPEVVDAGMYQRLRKAYLTLVEDTSEATEHDLQRFEQSVEELVENLDHQLTATGPLLEARVELVNQRIEADASRFQAEIIRTREAARLEAMAFEI